MPKLRPETEKVRAQILLKPLIRNKLNQSATARELGVSQATIQEKIHRPIVQKALQEQIEQIAKKTGITLSWLLKRYKIGAEDAKKIIGYLHQYKKDEDGNIEKINPDEIISNEFITTEDWATQRLYLRDIAEIMKWLKSNGVHLEQKNYVQIYRPEPYSREEMEASSRATDRSI